MVYVVARVKFMVLNRKHLICFGYSGVSVEKEKSYVVEPLETLGSSLQLVRKIDLKNISEGTPCKITVVIFTWIA